MPYVSSTRAGVALCHMMLCMALSDTQIERASYIRAVLGWHDVTQAGLARIIGSTQQSASLKLAGKRRFTDDELAAIVDHYGLDPAIVLKPARAAEVLGARQSDVGLSSSTKYQVCWSEALWGTPRLDQIRTSREAPALN